MNTTKTGFNIVAERKVSGTVGTWTEYLVVSRGSDQRYLLATATYLGIGFANDYFNLDKETYELPSSINNQTVAGILGEWVIGGEACINADELGFEFTRLDDQEMHHWLTKSGWIDNVNVDAVRAATAEFDIT